MPSSRTAALVLVLAAAAGIATGYGVDRVMDSRSDTPAAGGPSAPATSATGPATGSTPAPTTGGPSTPHPTPPTSGATTTSARPALTAESLIGPEAFTAAGVQGLTVASTDPNSPIDGVSICPDVANPSLAALKGRGSVVQRRMGNAATGVTAYELVVDFTSPVEAQAHTDTIQGWYDHCGTPAADSPIQQITNRDFMPRTIEGADQAFWWDRNYLENGAKMMQTTVVSRAGDRVALLVFSGPYETVRATTINSLLVPMTQRMA